MGQNKPTISKDHFAPGFKTMKGSYVFQGQICFSIIFYTSGIEISLHNSTSLRPTPNFEGPLYFDPCTKIIKICASNTILVIAVNEKKIIKSSPKNMK